ncbi:MAG: UDP-N-acetyl-alpha-D-glucosamine C6 dehydratase [Alphaproteobacteria bacterium MarineAlpha3_Bin5]|nr:nucleotide sugar dehydratase [Magnetovibrio sp.]PPR80206.1 MAG: UDP-N-acetyl-alpha-D-glucosamine C6 dehydratase [Alphaproteobacteria bacterium MarineAlpha3_Bin5]
MVIFHRLSARSIIAYGHDVIQAGLSFLLAIFLRFTGTTYYLDNNLVMQGMLVFTGIATIVFWFSGLYKGVWRYASIEDMAAITKAVSIIVLLYLLAMFLWARLDDLPRSIPIINWFILMALLGGPRFIYRFAKDYKKNSAMGDLAGRIPVLLVGAGDGADHFIRGLNQSSEKNYAIVGILSEETKVVGHHIRGINVIGTTTELSKIIKELHKKGIKPQRLILTKDFLDGVIIRGLFDIASSFGMTVSRIPKSTDFKTADSSSTEIKPIALEDLLGRPQTPLNREAMRGLIEGGIVLITGAGGSIGAELTRQVAALSPSELLLLDQSEYALYKIEQEINTQFPGLPLKTTIADIRNSDRITAIIRDNKPRVVFHAAALKHVPLVEKNISEGILTNVQGTKNVADACLAISVHTMVLVSTDKAVNPTSIMGATKRIAEMYCQTLDQKGSSIDSGNFITVRFGNVLGSTGSVVPLFQKQLEAGGPLTVTHPKMSRYFMTVGEAVELILEAAAIGTKYKRSQRGIFVLDMGEPVKILHLAQQMVRLSGFEPEKDIKIVFTGIRPGEKLSEELLHGAEHFLPTNSPGLHLAASRLIDFNQLCQDIASLVKSAQNNNTDKVYKQLKEIVPEYSIYKGLE